MMPIKKINFDQNIVLYPIIVGHAYRCMYNLSYSLTMQV